MSSRFHKFIINAPISQVQSPYGALSLSPVIANNRMAVRGKEWGQGYYDFQADDLYCDLIYPSILADFQAFEEARN